MQTVAYGIPTPYQPQSTHAVAQDVSGERYTQQARHLASHSTEFRTWAPPPPTRMRSSPPAPAQNLNTAAPYQPQRLCTHSSAGPSPSGNHPSFAHAYAPAPTFSSPQPAPYSCMVVAPSIPAFPRGPYIPFPPEPPYEARDPYDDPSLYADPYAHPHYVKAFRRPPSPVADGVYVVSASPPEGLHMPAYSPVHSPSHSSSLSSARSQPVDILPSPTSHPRRHPSSRAAIPDVSPAPSPASSIELPPRSIHSSPSSMASSLGPASPPEVFTIQPPPPIQAVTTTTTKSKLVKQRPLPKEPAPQLSNADWAGSGAPQQTIGESAPAIATKNAGRMTRWRFGKAAERPAPPVLSDAPVEPVRSIFVEDTNESVRMRPDSATSSFVVVPEFERQPQQPLWDSRAPRYQLSDPPVASSSSQIVQGPGIPNTKHTSTAAVVGSLPPSGARSTVSVPSSSVPSQSRASNSKTKTPPQPMVELDKIDELDETDPLGFAWHHSSPYEAIGSALGSKQASQVGSTKGSHLAPPSALGATSVHSKSRVYPGVGAHHAADGSRTQVGSAAPSPYPATMNFIPEALPDSQSRAYAGPSPRPAGKPQVSRFEDQSPVSPAKAIHANQPIARDYALSAASHGDSSSRHHHSHSHGSRSAVPSAGGRSHHSHVRDEVLHVPPPRGQTGHDDYDPYEDDHEDQYRGDDYGDERYDDYGRDDEAKYAARQPLAPADNLPLGSHRSRGSHHHSQHGHGPDEYAVPQLPTRDGHYQDAGAIPDTQVYGTYLTPHGGASRVGNGSIMSGSSDGRSGWSGRTGGAPPPTHRPRRLVMPAPLQGGQGPPTSGSRSTAGAGGGRSAVGSAYSRGAASFDPRSRHAYTSPPRPPPQQRYQQQVYQRSRDASPPLQVPPPQPPLIFAEAPIVMQEQAPEAVLPETERTASSEAREGRGKLVKKKAGAEVMEVKRSKSRGKDGEGFLSGIFGGGGGGGEEEQEVETQGPKRLRKGRFHVEW